MSRAIIVARISRLPWRRSLEHRASCVAVATRTSTGVACSPALEVPPPRAFEDAAACPYKGPAVARPLDRGTAATTPDRGTSATARRGNGVAATGLETAATALSSLALWIGGHRRRPGNRRHRMSRSGSRGHRSHRPRVHRSHRPRVHRRTRYRATAVANESRWGVKNWCLALRIFFYIRLDLVRLDRIALSGLGFL
jgi:hypothetical protein